MNLLFQDRISTEIVESPICSESTTERVVVRIPIYIIVTVFCPRVGPSLQPQGQRLQFCRRQVFHRKLMNQCCSFIRDD